MVELVFTFNFNGNKNDILNFLARLFSFFNKSKSKRAPKSTHFKQLLSHAENAERTGEFAKALNLYEDAINELETSLKYKMEGKYYRSKYSEIRFSIEKLKRQVEDSSNQTIKFPFDSKNSEAS